MHSYEGISILKQNYGTECEIQAFSYLGVIQLVILSTIRTIILEYNKRIRERPNLFFGPYTVPSEHCNQKS